MLKKLLLSVICLSFIICGLPSHIKAEEAPVTEEYLEEWKEKIGESAYFIYTPQTEQELLNLGDDEVIAVFEGVKVTKKLLNENLELDIDKITVNDFATNGLLPSFEINGPIEMNPSITPNAVVPDLGEGGSSYNGTYSLPSGVKGVIVSSIYQYSDGSNLGQIVLYLNNAHLKEFKDETKLLEYERLDQRTRHDVEMLREVGMCPGIENYSRHIDGRKEGQRPYTLIDYFPKDFLMIVDESHVMLPQVRGMYNGDRSRKETLVEYGFRLPSALDNRPLRFEEFEKIINQVIYVSATPGDYELEHVNNEVVEQIIRPTGLLDPKIEVRPTENQIDDIISEIKIRQEKNERVLITTLTKRMAEDLSAYLKELGIKVAYLHSDTKTLERTEILRDLRIGKYDVLVGINLLREGLDLPEVSLVCILDADKEGFLRSNRSLIQTIGRAARNSNGEVIMYGDKITDSMAYAIEETNRRRKIQDAYNKEHNIIPTTIHKEIRDAIRGQEVIDDAASLVKKGRKASKKDKQAMIHELEKQMKDAAKVLDFERAMELRDIIMELQGEK